MAQGPKQTYHPLPPRDECFRQAWIHHIGIQQKFHNTGRYHYRNHQRRLWPEASSVLLQVVVDGNAWFEGEDGASHELVAGEAFLCVLPSATSYGLKADQDCSWLWVQMCGQLALSLGQLVIERHGHIHDLSTRHIPIHQLERWWQERKENLQASPPTRLAEVAQLLSSLLEDPGQGTDPIDQALTAIADCSGDVNFDVQQLARMLGLSRSHFTRRFRQRYQCSPGSAITEARLQTACELLEMTDLSIADVAWRSGFADQSWFGVIFRRRFTTSPSVWRKNAHANN